MQRTTEGFWVLCSAYYSPLSLSLNPRCKWRERVSLGFVPDTKHVGCLSTATSSSRPSGHPGVNSSDTKSPKVTQKPQGESSIPEDGPHFKCWSQVLESLTRVTNWLSIQRFFDPISKLNMLSKPLTELGKFYLWSPVIIKVKTLRQWMGEEA